VLAVGTGIQDDDIATALVRMAQRASHQLTAAASAFLRQDPTAARLVISMDGQLNDDELRIDHAALREALTAPGPQQSWQDIATLLKITDELERVGDYAVAIAVNTTTNFAVTGRPSNNQVDVWLTAMLNQVGKMLVMAVHAYARRDAGVAQEVALGDREVDRLSVRVRALLGPITPGEPALAVSRLLSQSGDRAVNIAEWVVYQATGTLVTLHHEHNGQLLDE
jgi:phosphate transport system protein